MKPMLSPEEIARYSKRETISPDDPDAHAFPAGWKKLLAMKTCTRDDSIEGYRFRIYPPKSRTLPFNFEDVFAERWVDVREFARRRFGTEPEEVERLKPMIVSARTVWALRWGGSAMTPNDPVRLEFTETDWHHRRGRHATTWHDVRELPQAKPLRAA